MGRRIAIWMFVVLSPVNAIAQDAGWGMFWGALAFGSTKPKETTTECRQGQYRLGGSMSQQSCTTTLTEEGKRAAEEAAKQKAEKAGTKK